MNIQLQTQGFDLTDAIRAHVKKQINFNLVNFESHIMSVDVFLSDINGPKGGPDKKALVCIRLNSRSTVTVERTRADLYTAITLVSRQAKRTVRRALNKHRRMEKGALRELRQFSHI
jgi:ribosomal subunit interface protein